MKFNGICLINRYIRIGRYIGHCKQRAVTFEVFVLWLRNQCYYTRDVIGIKMTYSDLPYYKGISPKHAMNIKQAQR